MGDEYLVKTHIFEGPLDTLLSLIEKRKLFINDISLAQVADDYIAYVKSLESFPIADSAHFILIASTLVLIKSKSLLPQLTLTEDEQHSIEDLEARLSEYQKYKALSRHLKERFGINVEYLRQPSRDTVIVFAPDKNTNVPKLREVIQSVIVQMPKKEFVPKAVVEKVISLEEMMENLSARISTAVKMSFKEFSRSTSSGQAGTREERVNVIVSFLAMLELVKQGIINVRQDRDFHDIEIETQAVSTPRY
jgi:segregation and condensation protein A